jgi:SAM-dependent methyltransferase
MDLPVELACPTCSAALRFDEGGSWICLEKHIYPVVGGIPVLVSLTEEATHPALAYAQKIARGADPGAVAERVRHLDPLRFVVSELGATHGNLYRRIQSLPRLPVPQWPGPLEPDSVVVDVGGHWGRWALAAAQAGAVAIVVDPNLEATLVGQRIASSLALPVIYLVGDGRRLPLESNQADVVFSYSVLQHFSKDEARRMLAEMARVAQPRGQLMVQLPNRFGSRQAINRISQVAKRDTNPFRVRYWTPREIQATLRPLCDAISVEIDGFFALNPRNEDADLLPLPERALVRLSAMLARAARGPLALPLRAVADSLWAKGRVATEIPAAG